MCSNSRNTVVVVAIGLCITSAGYGQSGGGFDLSWNTFDGGGGMSSTGGGFELGGTIGQPDANTVVMTGGDFELSGGFWPVTLPTPGDMNCDGRVTFDDINPFVAALIGPAEYQAEYPNCNWLNGDIDGDGRVTFDDINPFVNCLVQQGCP